MMFLVGYICWPPTTGLFNPARAEVTAIASTIVRIANLLFMVAYPSKLNFDPQFNYGQVLNSDSFQIPVDKRNPFLLPVRIWVGKAGRSMVGKNIETGNWNGSRVTRMALLVLRFFPLRRDLFRFYCVALVAP